MILTPQSAAPRCDATVDLISRAQRPYLCRVTVTGKPPHEHRRVYTVQAPAGYDIERAFDSCAMKGIELFVKEFSNPVVAREMATLAPRAKLQ